MVRAITASPWAAEDRALLLAFSQYRATLCPGCGHPKATAWHFDNDGEFEVAARYTCHPCTVQRSRGDDVTTDPVTFTVVRDTRDYAENPLPGHYTEFAQHAALGGPIAAARPKDEEAL